MINKFKYGVVPSAFSVSSGGPNETEVSCNVLSDYFLNKRLMDDITKGTYISSPYTTGIVLESLLGRHVNLFNKSKLSDTIKDDINTLVELINSDDFDDRSEYDSRKRVHLMVNRMTSGHYGVRFDVLDGLKISKYLRKNPEVSDKLYKGLKLGSRKHAYGYRILGQKELEGLLRSRQITDDNAPLFTSGIPLVELISQIYQLLFDQTPNRSDLEDLYGNLNILDDATEFLNSIRHIKDRDDTINRSVSFNIEQLWIDVTSDQGALKWNAEYDIISYIIHQLYFVMYIMVTTDIQDFVSKNNENVSGISYRQVDTDIYIRNIIQSMDSYINMMVDVIELVFLLTPQIFNMDKVKPKIIHIESDGFGFNEYKIDKEIISTLIKASYIGDDYIIGQTNDFVDDYVNFIQNNYRDSKSLKYGNDHIYILEDTKIISEKRLEDDITEHVLLSGLSEFLGVADTHYNPEVRENNTFRGFNARSPEVLILSDIISMIDKSTRVETITKYTKLKVCEENLTYFEEFSDLAKILFHKYLEDNGTEYNLFEVHQEIVSGIQKYEQSIISPEDRIDKDTDGVKLRKYSDKLDLIKSLKVNGSKNEPEEELIWFQTNKGPELREDPEDIELDDNEEKKSDMLSKGGYRSLFRNL